LLVRAVHFPRSIWILHLRLHVCISSLVFFATYDLTLHFLFIVRSVLFSLHHRLVHTRTAVRLIVCRGRGIDALTCLASSVVVILTLATDEADVLSVHPLSLSSPYDHTPRRSYRLALPRSIYHWRCCRYHDLLYSRSSHILFICLICPTAPVVAFL